MYMYIYIYIYIACPYFKNLRFNDSHKYMFLQLHCPHVARAMEFVMLVSSESWNCRLLELYIYIYTYACVCIYIYTHCAYIYIYIHTHMYMYMPTNE